jgi:uncharacterized membrane protein YagU involved in acid resistance
VLVELVSVLEIHIEIRAEAGAPISSVNMIVKWVIFQAHFVFSIPFNYRYCNNSLKQYNFKYG